MNWSAFTEQVKGQKGEMPQIGLGTAGMNDAVCVQAIEDAVSLGLEISNRC